MAAIMMLAGPKQETHPGSNTIWENLTYLDPSNNGKHTDKKRIRARRKYGHEHNIKSRSLHMDEEVWRFESYR